MKETDSTSEMMMGFVVAVDRGLQERLGSYEFSSMSSLSNEQLDKIIHERLRNELPIVVEEMFNDKNVIKEFKKAIDELMAEMRKDPEMNGIPDYKLFERIGYEFLPDKMCELMRYASIARFLREFGLLFKIFDRVYPDLHDFE